ncbi:MAG: hypothetical protein RL536_582 [Candidatus Parcubacteria bacterium]
MPMLHPHKQTAFIFLVCVLGVLATIWYVGGTNNKQKALDDMSTRKNIQVTQMSDLIATSSDWQKQFFASSRSSDDLVSPKASLSGQSNNSTRASEEPDTITGQFGKKVFEQFMILKQNNLTDDQTAIKAAIDQNMSDIVSTAPQARIYDIRNILVSQNVDVSAEKTYANTVGSILSMYARQGDAATIATEALDKNDQSRIKEINVIAESYSNMLKKLLAVPAPKTISDMHLNLVNSASGMVFVSQGMAKIFSDPMQSMVSLAVYEKSLGSFQNALVSLKNNFEQKDIRFSNSDPGIIFTIIQ